MKEFKKFTNQVSILSENRVLEYGDVPRSVGWSSREQQYLRFHVLTKHICFSNSDSILDLGSGTSEFYGYLKENKFNNLDFTYKGFELSKSMVEIALNKYPSSGASVCDFWETDNVPKKQFDYVFCSGALNYRNDFSNLDLIRRFINLYFPITKKALVFNLISDNVDYMDPNLKYYDAGDCVSVVSEFTKNFVLDANYPLWEFTLIIFPNK